MAAPSETVKHLESYVDSSSSPAQQAASLDAIANLLKKDVLTLQSLVREMEMYLTTTDNIIRSRGILLLAELLSRLTVKPLDHATLHTLILFFTDRLADWKALRGALVGCLALMRRRGNVGVVTASEAHAVCKAFLENLQVQALGQHDRELCFELIECLLAGYPDAVAPLGDDLVYGICASIDAERDPRCLMLTFRIVEGLTQLFPDPSGPVGSYAEELFEILGCYFPIHFTHPKDNEVDVKRDDLARALMLAFASTPIFEPFVIPLLLEKLSSSLPSAKVESLKYLNYCTVKYGADRMEKHIEVLWSSLKDTIYSLPLASEPVYTMQFQQSELAAEALTLLEKLIMQSNRFLNLILCDEKITSATEFIASFKDYVDISMQDKQRLCAVGQILSVSARASIVSCNRVFERFLPQLENTVSFSTRPSFGALYLCVELLAACRYLVVGSVELSSKILSLEEKWCCLLDKYCSSLIKAFGSTLATSMNISSKDAYVYSGVKGLQILSTFPGSFVPVSKHTFENILMQLMLTITLDFKETSSWKLVLRSLVEIGIYIDKSHESVKAKSFHNFVVEKIVSLLSDEDCNMPMTLRVEALTEIGTTSKDFMLRIVQGLDNAIHANLSRVYVHSDLKLAEFAAQLLDCYTYKVLPWFQENGGFEAVALPFAVNIWDQIGHSSSFTFSFQKLHDATTMAIKVAVGGCSEEIQSTLVKKAFSIVSSSTSTHVTELIHGTICVEMEEGSQFPCDIGFFSIRDKEIISLFASVIIALCPQTPIVNPQAIMHLFLTALLDGHVPSAQALGSLVNKLPLKATGTNDFTVEEAIHLVCNSKVMKSCSDRPLMRYSGVVDRSEIHPNGLRHSSVDTSLVQIHSINGLAWIGKGLLMRGHEKLKDIIVVFLGLLTTNDDVRALPFKDPKEQELFTVMKSASDAFHTLMSDFEDCLNKRFNATIRPLYKQRFFNTVMPLLLSSLANSDAPITRSMLYRAIAHIISNTPLIAILSEAKKLIPVMLDGLSVLSEDIENKDIIYSVLLVLSGMLMDKNAVIDNALHIIKRLVELIPYSHKMLIRETAIQCLIAMSELPHSTIYPMRTQVLLALSKALDDPKRAVRQEAVRCRQAWGSMAHRSLRF